MATNPMQRKARNSMLLGILITLLITGAIIVLLFLQIKNYKEKEKAELDARVKVCVLNQDVKSGQIITSDMLITQEVNKNMIPQDAFGNAGLIDSYALEDKEGNEVITENGKLFLKKSEGKYELKQEDTGNYYITRNNNKEYVELDSVPIVAKVNMNKNTVVTKELITKGDNTTANDVRKQEYNMILLPTQLETGEYVDIRLSLPTGQDYIVVAKKEVTIPEIGGVPSASTIWLNLSEDEILTMNNAIVEAAYIEGTKLYATTYTEAGIQTAAIPTYPVSREIYTLIKNDPNVVQKAIQELESRYNQAQLEQRNNVINSAISNNAGNGLDNVKSKTEESGTKSKEERKSYLDSLGHN